MKNIIVSDLDGTLLKEDKTLSEYTKMVIEKLKSAGFIFVIATARPKDAALKLIGELPFDAAIFQNGAHVLLADSKEEYAVIEQQAAYAIIQNISEVTGQANVAIETITNRYANFDSSSLWPDVTFAKENFRTATHDDILKILVPLGENQFFDKSWLKRGLHLSIAEGKLAMITKEQATKWGGLTRILAYYNLPAEKLISFGDDLIDCEMLQKAGRGVAMKNALPEVKAVANNITVDDNNHDGVARWLEENILKDELK